MKAHREVEVLFCSFFNLDTWWKWVVHAMFWPVLTMGMTYYQLYRRLGRPKQMPAWKRVENFAATRFQSPCPPAHSKSPYQLRPTGLNGDGFHILRTMTCLCHCTKLATVISDGLIHTAQYIPYWIQAWMYISYFNMFHLPYINQVHNI
jgi:hypothetical protein